METGVFWELRSMSDDTLRSQLTLLLASGYRTEARIIAHLAEVDERKLYLKDGSESLFAYCTLRLGLSSSEAFHRTTAAQPRERRAILPSAQSAHGRARLRTRIHRATTRETRSSTVNRRQFC